MTAHSPAGLVLAAGAGRRLGRTKPDLVVGGRRLVDAAVGLLAESGCFPVVVVTGAWHGPVPGAETVHNPDWARGLGSSLAMGLRHLADTTSAPAAVVLLVDEVGITPGAVAAAAGSSAELAVTAREGGSGHPVRLGRGHWEPILARPSGDAGARDYLREHRDEVAVLGVQPAPRVRDIDTPADLAAVCGLRP